MQNLYQEKKIFYYKNHIQEVNTIVKTQRESTPMSCRQLILYAQDSLVNHFQLPEEDLDLLIREARSFMKSSEWLKQKGLNIFSLKMFQGYSITTGGKHSSLSSPQFMSWGIVSNGVCLTAPILVCHSREKEYTLSDILIKDCPEKYFLSDKAAAVILSKSREAHKGAEFILLTE